MNEEQQEKTLTDRQMYVVKANELIRQACYSLTAQEQKTLLYIVSKVRPDDQPDTFYTFSTIDVCRACGIEIDDGGFYYKVIKDNIIALQTPKWCRMTGRKGEFSFAWLANEDAHIDKADGQFTVRFTHEVQRYLFGLTGNYTQYKLEKILAFKEKYTIRIYEILRSYLPQKFIDEGREQEVTISLSKLKEQIQKQGKEADADKELYPVWYEFKRNVLDKAVKEINAYNDEMHVSYWTIKKGRSVDKIHFLMEPAKAKQMLEAHRRTRERLNGKRGTNE